MAEQQPNDLQRARREACELLGFRDDAERLCASDRLRGDLVVSLRLAIDDASASLIDGNRSRSTDQRDEAKAKFREASEKAKARCRD